MSKIIEDRVRGFSEKIKKDVIQGKPAFGGVASGRVRICLSSQNASKLVPGEVLVTSMTTPDFVPAMKIASAIITDEGGLLCHAAIISRELGIPCIIGTRVATSMLKDGDKVEVNAEKGIARKLP